MISKLLLSSSRKNIEHLFVGEQGIGDLNLYMLELKNAYMEFMNDDQI